MSTAAAPAIAETIWPNGFSPAGASVHAWALRRTHVSPEQVFAWVRRVDLIGQFYGDVKFARSRGGAWPEVDGSSKVFFLALGLPASVKVGVYDEGVRLGWTGGGPGVKAWHIFTVAPDGEGGTHLRSEEAWTGIGSKLLGPVIGPGMQRVQSGWADGVIKAAEGGFPPAP
jgi:hypothetical protein